MRAAGFCDGSKGRGSARGRGGYAIVYARFHPNSPDNGKLVEKAWFIKPGHDNNVCEALSIAEQIRHIRNDITAWRDEVFAKLRPTIRNLSASAE